MAEHSISLKDREGTIYGPYSGTVVTLGRFSDYNGRFHQLDPNENLVIPYSFISKRHCRIDVRGGDNPLTVKDLESTNGTYINGEKINEVLLKDGDILSLGQEGIEFNVIVEVKERKKGILKGNIFQWLLRRGG